MVYSILIIPNCGIGHERAICHSGFLILGAIDQEGKVVLLHPSQKTDDGLPVAYIMPENGEKKSNTVRVRYTTRKKSWFIRVNFEKENVMVKENNTVKMEPSIMTDSGETIRNMVKALFLPKMVNKFSQEISGKEGELISESN